MLSSKTKYGLKALLTLAREVDTGPISIATLAARDEIPKKFLEAILLQLNRHGIVGSKKGQTGGYFLSRPATEITFGEAMRALEGPLAAVPCVSQTAYRRCEDCPDEDTCGVRLAMKRVRDATAEILDHATLADINAQLARTAKKRRRKS